MADFLMPSLGADMERGILSEWLVEPGQAVAKGDIIAVVETDKGAIEIEVWTAGTVEALLAEEGEELAVGAVLAHIREDAADAAAEVPAPEPTPPPTAEPAPPAEPAGPAEPAAAAGPAAPAEPAAAAKPAPPPAAEPRPAMAPAPHAEPGRVRASPWARHLAAERGVGLAGLAGTGPDGAILGRDVPEPATAPSASRPPPEDALAAMRRAVARAMEKSKREIPHYYLSTEVDVTEALAWLARTNAAVPPPERVLPAALWLRAVALAVRAAPEVNGLWRDGALHRSEAVHLGVAVALRGGGLVAPAVHDVDKRALPELMRHLTDLVARARRGRLRGSEMTDATLTVTSMGDRGVERVDGVIYPPQVGIVGVGRPTERAWVVGGELAVRTVLTLSFAGDHRAHDGHVGARFLSAIAELLATPEAL